MSNYSIGLSGLNSNSAAIDTISNNIANSSTVGYKAGEYIFQDQFYKAINPLDPARAGQGTAKQNIRRLMNMGTVQDSQNTLDMAITGSMGMFRLTDANDPDTVYYTRNGQFAVSKEVDPNFPKRSYIVNQNGMFLTGYSSQDGTTLGDAWTDKISMPPTELEPKTTTLSTIAVNLDARTNTFLDVGDVPFDPQTVSSYNNKVTQTVYSADDNGGAHTLTLYYRRTDDLDKTVTYDGANFYLGASDIAKNPIGASEVNVVLSNDTSAGVSLISAANRSTTVDGAMTSSTSINVNNAAGIERYARMMVNGLDRGVAVATTPSTAAGGVATRAASTANVEAVTAVAQVDTVTIAGTFSDNAPGTADTATVTINGTSYTHTVTSGQTNAQIASALAALVNADGGLPVTASVSSGVITLTADTAGTAFTATASESTAGDGTATRAASVANVAAVTAVAQVDEIELTGNYSEGDVISVTVNNVDLDYTVTAADIAGGGNTTADYSRILTNLVAAYNASTRTAHTPVTAAHTSGTAVASFTADTAGTAFTAASTVDGAPALTLDVATTVSDGDEVKFFNPATTSTGASSTGSGARTVTISSNSYIQQDQYVFKLVNDGTTDVVTRVVDANGDPITVSGVSGTTLTLSAVPSEDLSSDTLIFYNPVSYGLTMQDGSKVSMSGDLFSGEANQQFTAVTTRYEVYASLDDQFFNAGNNNFYSDVEFNAPVGGGLYKPVAEMQFWGGKNIDALVTNPVTGLPTFESQIVLTGKVTTPGNNPTNMDPDLIFNLDLTGTRNFATPFGVDQSTQDGRSVALLNSVTISDEGEVVGTYGDGRTFLAGQVALVNFAATDGLVPSGNNVFAASYLSGDEVHPNVTVGKPGQKGLGGIRAGAVEGSNVDLANELVKLLIQQRMYSANSQSIRAFDDTLTTTIRMAGG
jgi:flagellar hook-basal body protein